jgi:cytochrome c biogenesis protein CcdA/thiol-disulfide isomerase/thioredoxin
MTLLTAFALLAGAVTAISPCVLPVLPALLSATGTGGRRRPMGVVAGLTLTFFITIIGFATVVDGVGLADGTTRSLAIVVLAGFGLALLLRVEMPLAVLTRLGPRTRGDGFLSGLAVGGALGFVYAPCAGPILAGVISVSASQGATAETVVVGAAYALGSGLTLLGLALGGRRVMGARAAMLQRAMGAVMVLTALAMTLDLDTRFQTALANDFPSFVTNPTRALEKSGAVERGLRDLRGKSRFDAAGAKPAARRGTASGLPRLGAAPELAGTGRWFNSPPLTLRGLRGKVVLIDFWTYTCINCIRTLPFEKRLDERYRRAGLVIIGVHTPEFSFEKNAGNVAASIRQNQLRYPVVQDNDYETWNAFGNQFWPAKYLIDATGEVRYTHFGEGDYDKTENAVRGLLREAGAARLARAGGPPIAVPTGRLTPETYLGSARAEHPSRFTLTGDWDVSEESATSGRGAHIDGDVTARDVYLVLGSRGDAPRRVRVYVDGRLHRTVTVRRQRLYTLVQLPAIRDFHLRLDVGAGISGYAFTFG